MNRNSRAFQMGVWLGWQLESNWTEPLTFIAFALFRPIASALILTVIYRVIASLGAANADALFAYAYVSNAAYVLVGNLLQGMSWAVLEDRERMGMLKFVAIAPSSLYAYLMGRGVAKTLAALVSMPITLGMGALLLGVPISFATINWAYLLTAMLLGLAIVSGFGLILAGITMMTARHGGFLGEAVASSLFVFIGVLFPITVLPTPLEWVARALPLTYWLEAVRRSMLSGQRGPGFENLGDPQLLLLLLGMAVLVLAFSLPMERWAEHHAKERGLLDLTTAY